MSEQEKPKRGPGRPPKDVLAAVREAAKRVPDVPHRPFADELGKVVQQLLEELRGVR